MSTRTPQSGPHNNPRFDDREEAHLQMTHNIIEISDLKKTFTTGKGSHPVLKGLDLSIREGSIFGIIGLSGSGKSTLVRCLNGIETTNSGNLKVLGRSIPDLASKELLTLRESIGMVFQQYNLMPSRTVANNIALPLRKSKLSAAQKKKRVAELLELVGLQDRAHAYPRQLSGGQQQRVAIARALANHPKVLLLDEATSALDPDTTKTILKLVKQLNKQLQLTIIVVTHEMSVVKEICTDVAVMDQGKIIEHGVSFTVFSDPKAELTQRFVYNSTGLNGILELIEEDSPVMRVAPGERLVHMQYIDKTVSEGLVSLITQRFSLSINILYASLDIVDSYPLGSMIAKYSGTDLQINHALDFLAGKGIRPTVLKVADTRDNTANTDDPRNNATEGGAR